MSLAFYKSIPSDFRSERLSSFARLGIGAVFIVICSSIGLFLPLWIYLLCIVSLPVLFICLLKPEKSIYLLIFLIPVTTWAVYLLIRGDWNFIVGNVFIDLIPIYLPILTCSFIGLVLTRWARIKILSYPNPLRVPLVILLLYAALTLLWTPNIGHSLFQFVALLMNVILFVLLVSIINDETILRKVMWCWLLSVTSQGILALAFLFFDTTFSLWEISANTAFGISIFGGFLQPSGYPQVASGLQDTHETALIMNLGLAVALGLLLTSRKRWQKVLLLCIAALLLVVLLKTETRQGMVALLVMTTAFFIMVKSLRRWITLLLPLLYLLILGVYFTQHYTLAAIFEYKMSPRLLNLGTKVLKTGDVVDPELKSTKEKPGRRKLWGKGFKKYHPVALFGLGVGNFKYHLKAPHAHSIYFSFLFDFGLAGLLFLFSFFYILIRASLTVIGHQQTYLQIMSVACMGGFIALGVQGMVDFEYNTTTFWLFSGLAVATLNLTGKQVSALGDKK